MPIMFSDNNGQVLAEETSESNSSSHHPLNPPNKRMKHDNNNNNISSSTKFKGVVSQQNGHWGAQIYANHQRVWLGTFKSEKEAAMAYDSAAIKLRSGDSHRNFPWTSVSLQEPKFQNNYTTEAVLNMIKDGSYPSKFADFLRTQSQRLQEKELSLNTVREWNNGGIFCRQLFQKELTPSDVGKLNRLVIPKKYAVKYFPHISESASENADGGGVVGDIQLVFHDRLMRSWKFRYCYWKSSQSYVFTRGWNRFVKEKDLKAKDIITFNVCEHREGERLGQTFCIIDVGYGGGEGNDNLVEKADQNDESQVELRLGLGHSFETEDTEESEEKQLNGSESKLEPKLFVHLSLWRVL
ncbi:B3 DNA binding domain [Dillenia turbinata]|uniref:B3 DNA binding domain n=1 Tax=Dillenia turbinata TaxID=194707 RepID=A0AAN8ZDD7_9MAGN